jgi:hypothetical protein
MSDQERIEAAKARYMAAAHAVQSAIGFSMHASSITEPKHMRTGIDMTKSDMGAITRLLVTKGICTDIEIWEALAEGAEAEAEMQATSARHAMGMPDEVIFK